MFEAYLSDVSRLFEKVKSKEVSHLNVALGNVSGDMDSVVGSVMMGYWLSHKKGFYEHPEEDEVARLNRFVFPVINFTLKEMDFRLDIIHHFETCKVDFTVLPFFSQVPFDHYVSSKQLSIYLIDHNSLDCFEVDLAPFIRGILDHHIDKGEYDHLLDFKDVRFCGAAATIVISHILFDNLGSILEDSNAKLFISAPIIIDTKHFKEELYNKKWNDLDRRNYAKLFPEGEFQEEYFEKLWKLKTDEELNLSLGWPALQRKDYKNYRFGKTLMGISTVFLDAKFIQDSYGKDHLIQEIENIMSEKGLNVYSILTSYEVEEQTKRQCIIYCK